LHHAERAGFNAKSAACAQILVDQNNAVFSFGYSLLGAGIPASGLAAMNTVANLVSKLRLSGDFLYLRRRDSYPSGANRYIVFLLAGYFTSRTAATIRSIDNKSVFHQRDSP
jgi:hypothetical protein